MCLSLFVVVYLFLLVMLESQNTTCLDENCMCVFNLIINLCLVLEVLTLPTSQKDFLLPWEG